MGDDFTGLQDIIPQTLDEQTVLSYTSEVPPSLLKAVMLTGTPAEVIDQAAEWRDHGLRYAVMADASAFKPSLRRGLAATVPFTKILRDSASYKPGRSLVTCLGFRRPSISSTRARYVDAGRRVG
jgi:phthiodiolone/phenolphthiodiolone dimycocerosates ketoreductase